MDTKNLVKIIVTPASVSINLHFQSHLLVVLVLVSDNLEQFAKMLVFWCPLIFCSCFIYSRFSVLDHM